MNNRTYISSIIDLNCITRAALFAKTESLYKGKNKEKEKVMNKNQISDLIDILWQAPPDIASRVLVAHILRQVGRRYIGKRTAKYLIEGIIKIENSIKDPEERKYYLLVFINLFKWIYESIESYDNNTLREIMGSSNLSSITFSEFVSRLIDNKES